MRKLLHIITVTILFFCIYMNGPMTANAKIDYVPTAGVYINGKIVNGINPILEDTVYYLPFVDLAKI